MRIRQARVELQLPPEAYGIRLTHPEFFAAAAKRGMHVDIWTVNEPLAIATLIKDGVGGVITDYPDRMLSLYDGL